MIDYIVVGYGLAGLSFVEQLERNNKSYIVFENNSQQSSRVAGGLYNPVILKRFTAAWQVVDQLAYAIPFYKQIESKLLEDFLVDLEVFRRFNSVEEQNMWFEACDKPILNKFLSSELYSNYNNSLLATYKYGKVNHTGRVKVKEMLLSYLTFLDAKGRLKKESFDHNNITIHTDFIEYKGMKSRHVVFTEGFGMIDNPYFQYLPMRGNKGEYLIIKSKGLQLNMAVKSSIFIIPLGDDLYKVGATYDNKDKTASNTEKAKEQLEKKLSKFMQSDYEIIDQQAGIRPSIVDRRPIVGTHPKYKNLHILNGLGSRGILIAPLTSEKLYNYIENKSTLDKEIDIKRFEGSL